MSDREGLRSEERDNLDGLVDKTPYFQSRRHIFHPWSGNSDPACRLAQPGKKEAQSLLFPSPTNSKKKRRFVDEKKKRRSEERTREGENSGRFFGKTLSFCFHSSGVKLAPQVSYILENKNMTVG